MQNKKSLKGAEKLVYIINLAFSFALLISYVLPFISPEKASRISILSLLFPLLYGVNILFLMYWTVKLKRQLILSLLILAFGYNHFSSLFKFQGKEIIQNKDISVMSYNVKMLNYYKWNVDDSLANKTIDFIESKKPDILVLQEFFNHKNIEIKYPFNFIKLRSKTNKFGLAIFSKYEIINSGSLNFDSKANNAIYCDILIKKDTVRVYNIHLESLKVNPDKENFGEKDSNKLLARLSNTFKKQAKQIAVFKEHENTWSGKKIIAGDLNNTAFSWAYHEIKSKKKDAFIEAGKGFGKSFDYPFPLRIDFILPDENMTVNFFSTYPVKYSDHYPIMARINLK